MVNIDKNHLSYRYRQRKTALDHHRTEMMDYWRELSKQVLCTRGRFLGTNSNKRKMERNTSQYNNTARLAARTLASGMMAGITSPARPWFKLNASQPELNDISAVREWLHHAEVLLYRVFASSNTYNSLHTIYGELGTFGTGAMGVFEDFRSVIKCRTYTVGSYWLGQTAEDGIDTFFRTYTLTAEQLYKQYRGNVSEAVKRAYDSKNYEAPFDVTFCVKPNENYKAGSPFNTQMPFESVRYEEGALNSGAPFLSKSGFMEFPILTPRWDIAAEELYGSDCPAMVALGDVKALQLGEKRMYQALDKVGLPPLQGPSTLVNQLNNAAPKPGEMVSVSSGDQLASVYGNYNPRLDYMLNVQQNVEYRIKRAFYEDLFLMLANSDRRQMTAREVAEKHEEKLLALGPVLERLHNELLNKLIDRAFSILQRNGVLRPAPRELVDTEISVEYVSILAQAQRMVGLTSIERTVGFAIQASQVWPEARHKINIHEAIDQYAGDAGVPPHLIRADDEAMELVKMESQARAQQQQLEQAAVASDSLQKVAKVDQQGTADMMRAAGLMA